jgi:hypothetical protein
MKLLNPMLHGDTMGNAERQHNATNINNELNQYRKRIAELESKLNITNSILSLTETNLTATQSKDQAKLDEVKSIN